MRMLWMLPLLAGCTLAADAVDPPLAQLARWRDATPEAIAAEPVVQPCEAANPACRELHLARAEACMGLAMRARGDGAACPGPAARPLLDCAAAEYPTETPLLSGNAALALLCRAEMTGAAADAERAAALAEGQPVLSVWAAMLRARLAPLPERCALAQRATVLATQAPAAQQAWLRADLALLTKGCAP